MPQLVKGGKYVFGWTTINNELQIRIPDEAFEEYQLFKANKIVLISGSKASGGFGTCSTDSLIKTKFSHNLIKLTGYVKKTDSFTTGNLEILKTGDRWICWTYLNKKKYLSLSPELLSLLGLKAGDKLLAARGSGIGPSFIARGIIYNEALKHNNLLEY
jgi:hypothetical protein